MSNKTAFLNLEQPQNGEYVDNWEIPVNNNSAIIDAWTLAVDNEITDARGSKTSLALFLAVGHDGAGNLLPTPEMTNSRNSPVYGSRDVDGTYDLKKRADKGDWESFDAREAKTSLKANLAAHHAESANMILDGGKDPNGYPTWAAFATDVVTVTVPPTLELLIAGYRCHVRDLLPITLTGGTGTNYIYAQYQPDGVAVVDKSGGTDGVTSNDDVPEARIFTDGGLTDFQVAGVQAGDILKILNTDEIGEYVIEQVGYQSSGEPSVDYTKLLITGLFPVGGLAGISYQVVDPLAVTLGFETVENTDADKMVIVEADIVESGGNVTVTAVRPRHYKNTFIGDWRTVADVGSTPTFEEIWNHNFGSDMIDVSVQVSSANNGSQPVEELSLADLTAEITLARTQDDLAATVGTLGLTGVVEADNGTLALTPNTGPILSGVVAADNGTLDISGNPSLTGDIVYELTQASVVLTRSAKAKWSRNQIWVKNSVSGKFYKDYAGTEKTDGFIRVIIRKRG